MVAVAADLDQPQTDTPVPLDSDQRALRLLLELRTHGFNVETLKVGDVVLEGVTDHLPHPQAQLDRARAEQRSEQSDRTSSYVTEFGHDLVDGAARQ